MENDNTFQYTYSAKEQAKIREIRSKYLPKEENKIEQIQRLDASVTQKATMYAIIVGVVGTLLFGTGLSCCMTQTGKWFALGIPVGIAGLLVLAAAYPLYNHVVQKERKRIAPEILRLSDELLK